MDKIFRIKGWFKKRGQKMSFTKETPSDSKNLVIEHLYSNLGSKHGVKRNSIHITSVEEIDPEEVKDPDVREFVGVE